MEDEQLITVLSDEESRELLSATRFGRIAFALNGRVEIYPLNIAYSEESGSGSAGEIVFKSAPGFKLAGASIAKEVVFQADALGDGFATSIVARGEARVLSTEAELEWAADLDVSPLIATPKNEYVAIKVGEVSGRRYVTGEELEPLIDTVA
ncbi:pyridoxamine 5'-phosphate oxidase family protein [Pseudoclavibacter sp. AY1F1]|uniref:pyridoxamine 5'-phosphate oxidase family protein n=1 Tax=Pseudoclavibacter sp. AY1F1 TaxID=2080583 RepID=UPI0015E2FDEF|nr:pyridoxamine 5'-phosphate oxidase family protein [Pseudoclavibacter sp. AY1F1]